MFPSSQSYITFFRFLIFDVKLCHFELNCSIFRLSFLIYTKILIKNCFIINELYLYVTNTQALQQKTEWTRCWRSSRCPRWTTPSACMAAGWCWPACTTNRTQSRWSGRSCRWNTWMWKNDQLKSLNHNAISNCLILASLPYQFSQKLMES